MVQSCYHRDARRSLTQPLDFVVFYLREERIKTKKLCFCFVLSLTNCYYISDWSAATDQGTNANSMTAEALVTALNNGTKNWCIYRGNAIPIMVNLVISTKAQ